MQVGAFPHFGGRWSEWNGTFRDDVRQFVKGTDGEFIGAFASALMGSPEIYGKSECAETDWWGNNGGARWRGNRGPQHTVNFVTAHDGFSLADLVAYNDKHNSANGEDNNDGVARPLPLNPRRCTRCGVRRCMRGSSRTRGGVSQSHAVRSGVGGPGAGCMIVAGSVTL